MQTRVRGTASIIAAVKKAGITPCSVEASLVNAAVFITDGSKRTLCEDPVPLLDSEKH